MGRDKAGLSLKGENFLICQIKKAECLGIREVFLSGQGTGDLLKEWTESKSGVHIREIADIYRDRGPLGGIHACMKVMETPYCLVLPIDVPQIPEAVLEELLMTYEKNKAPDFSGAVSCEADMGKSDHPLLLVHNGRKEPLIAVYPVSMADGIEETIKQGSAPVFRALDETGYDLCPVSVEEWQVGNINTPEDYRELLTYMEKRKER